MKSWLLDEPSDARAIDVIRASDLLRTEATQVMISLLDEARRPATADQVRSTIGQRFALFPQPHRTDGEWAAWWADYIDALAGLTPSAVEAGMAAWVRDPEAEFLCKPGRLRELAEQTPHLNRWARAHDRARRATFEPPAPLPPPPERERPPKEEMARMLAQFHEAMKAKDPTPKRKPARPSPSAWMAEGSFMSEEMKARLQEMRQ